MRTDFVVFFFSSRRRHTRWNCDWSSDVCSSDLHRRLGRLRRYLRVRTERLQKDLLTATLLSSPRYCDPRHLCHFEAQVYSQHGEDGIISEILARIGHTNRTFVEIGAGDGTENNTRYRLNL